MRVLTLSGLAICLAAIAQDGARTTANPTAAEDIALYSVSALTDGTGFVRIPPGEFMMGSADGLPDERPKHRVRISQGFEMSKFEVTQAQWATVMEDPHRKSTDKPSPDQISTEPSHFKGLSRPVENISWDAVQVFIRRLNVRDGTHLYRLPTEAEWEYAARAGGREDRPASPGAVAWIQENSGDETHSAGQKQPNAWGLYDMFGNVQEWVQDWYGPESYAESRTNDPQGPPNGSYKVYRGGAWLSESKQCRPAFRAFDLAGNGTYAVGFRLVRTAK